MAHSLAILTITALMLTSVGLTTNDLAPGDDIVGPDPGADEGGHAVAFFAAAPADKADLWIADVLPRIVNDASGTWVVLPHPDPAIVSAAWWDEDNVFHEVVPQSFKLFDLENGLKGTMTLMPDGTYGYVHGGGLEAAFDIVVRDSGSWVDASWEHHAHETTTAMSPQATQEASQDVVARAAEICRDLEADGVMDYETPCEIVWNRNGTSQPNSGPSTDVVSTPPIATPVKHDVIHESISSYATNSCNHAKDRIFDDETSLDYECRVLSVPPSRHGDGLANGWGDWQNFLDAYFNGDYNYKSRAESYNGGRQVHYMVDDTTLVKPDGTSIWGTSSRSGCSGGASWASATNHRGIHCGHTLQKRATSDFYVHSMYYRTGQTFTHELGHIHGVDHDDDSHVDINQNGYENCYQWGVDFTSWNLMRSGGKDKMCSHRHYWLDSAVVAGFEAGAATHAANYP